MKAVFLFLCIVIIVPISTAQIRGIVVDESKNPLESANIVLQAVHNMQAIATVSDKDGKFIISAKNFPDTISLLIISSIGYKAQSYELQNMSSNTDLGEIILEKAETGLKEIVVSAPHTITQIDRRLFFPSRNVVKNSSDGYDLLNKLMLPGLRIDIIQKTISRSGGGDVALYINEKKATKADIISLLPDEVIRVEYIDAPGVQYANDKVEAVINLIVKRRYAGLVTGINMTNAVTTGNGNDMAYVKYNHKLSEFGVQYYTNYGAVNGRYIDQNDQYAMPDGSSVSIDRKGINTYLKYIQHNIEMIYNLSKPQKYVFETKLTGVFYDSPDRGNKQYVTETGKPGYYSRTDPTEKYHRPELNVFYKLILPHNQSLLANAVGTYISTRNGQSYREYSTDDFRNPFNGYEYYTDGEKHSLISELRYIKRFKPFSFSAGLNHLQAYTENEYTGTSNATNRMKTANSYAYAQLKGKIEKLDYIGGVGVSRQYYHQEDAMYTYWLFRPSLTLAYPLSKSSKLRYRFYISPNIPPLSSLSDVEQQVNEWEIRVGNPGLKPYSSINNHFTFTFENSRFNMENTVRYIYSRNAIMEDISRIVKADGILFAYGNNNQRHLKMLSNYTAFQYFVIPEKLTIQGDLTLSRTQSKGNAYDHSLNAIQGGIQADLYIGKLNIGGGYKSRDKGLMGETVNYTSDYSLIYVNCHIRNMNFGLNWSNLFHNVSYIDKTMSRYVNKNLQVNIPDYTNMISLSFSINLNKGRKYDAPQSTLSNSDSESGVFTY